MVNIQKLAKEEAFFMAHMIDHMSDSFKVSTKAVTNAAKLIIRQGDIRPNDAVKALYANKNMAKKLVDILKKHIEEQKKKDETENAEKVDESLYFYHDTKPLEIHSPWREPVGNFPHSTFNVPEGAAIGPSIYQ